MSSGVLAYLLPRGHELPNSAEKHQLWSQLFLIVRDLAL